MDQLEFEVHKANLEKNKALGIKIVSDSMEPLLKVSDTAFVVEKSQRPKFETFDLIVYFFENHLRCHFVWRDQRDFNQGVVTRSLKEPYSNEGIVYDSNILGWVPNKKIPWVLKFKIVFMSLLMRKL
jgi:hypothetical protein